ncbi:RHS repeat-associated core domain-containing protein [Leptospira interrogans]|nr:RHS repeat-associated core domain-containing protein [Leptospira interrogans]
MRARPGTENKEEFCRGTPWILAMGANVAPGVPSIQNSGVGMTGGGSVGGMPVTGMYFYHPNHLGSITMITDGAGNPASGPEPGVSYVSYEPYGSIIRNDSYGPDIFRYKFTSQIEDKETGLYYYKARYYEPTLGRFLQADSVIAPDSVNGMNRYMYVDGNPVSYTDASGNRISTPLAWGLMGALTANQSGLTQEQGFLIGYGIGNKIHRDNKKSDFEKVIGGIGNGIQRATFVSKKRLFDLTNPGRFFYPNMRHIIPPERKDMAINKLRRDIGTIYFIRLKETEGSMSKEESDNLILLYIGAAGIVDAQWNQGTNAMFGGKFHLP